uniref:Uncharacterized protein n=1 Tax=Zea mays TaxID=4577 RepID=C0PN97_MAIZE|nr:unknown [Zea mays]
MNLRADGQTRGSADDGFSSAAHATCPRFTATSYGILPTESRWRRSAPQESSCRTQSRLPPRAAKCSGVLPGNPKAPLEADTMAPFSSRTWTQRRQPCLAARCSGVAPVSSRTFTKRANPLHLHSRIPTPARTWPPRGWSGGSPRARSRPRSAGTSADARNRTSRYWRRRREAAGRSRSSRASPRASMPSACGG